MLMIYVSLGYPQQVCKNCYQYVMNIVLVILLHLMLRNLYACSFECTVNKHCDNSTVFFSENQIDTVQEVKGI